MKYDSIIIGFGKGGKTLAGALAKKGERVALIEKSEMMYGGTCINVGCIPSKFLVDNGEKATSNLNFEDMANYYRQAVVEEKALTSMLRKKNYDKLNDLPNVDVINGSASFLDETNIMVHTVGGDKTLAGDKFFINTGAVPVIPDIQGIKDNPHVYVSETLLVEENLPKKLTIIGGGYIGLEFASIYASFGSDVTMLVHGAEFIPREDEDIAFEIKKRLLEKGVKILLSADTKKVEGDSITYEKDGEEFVIEDTKILVATGRKANTASLNLEKAGVELTDRGLVKVDERLKTTAPNIWAMGDVCGPLQFTYISLDDFRIIRSQLMGDGSYTTKERKNVPYSVFLSPTFSRVGINEKDAAKDGKSIKVLSMSTAAVPKAQVLKKTEGLLKAIVDEETGKILGAMLFCEDSHEMINLVKLAMDLDGDYTLLRDMVFTHPTMSEALNDLFAV